MKYRFLYVFPVLATICGAANANWQYNGRYVGDGAYTDDGSRFVVSGRFGAAAQFAGIKNKVGALAAHYWADGDSIVSEAFCGGRDGCISQGYEYLGYGDIGNLSASKDFSDVSFAAGASIGWTMPNRPQWRIELGWDHIGETEYNVSPLFEGELALTGGAADALWVESSSVRSEIVTDIISAMAFYDFFDGMFKPVHKVIPYVGFGIGYADSKTTLNLSDPYGDLSEDSDLRNFGTYDPTTGVVNFYHSETSSSNIAGLVAVGLSYGITDQLFFDLGARVAYVPKIKWALSNETGSRHRDWFSADNMIYANIMLGLRFEF